jgi:hypothetical protein
MGCVGGGRGGGGCPSTFMAGPCTLQAQPGAADSQPPTSALLQSVDPNHLVSTGAEGFWDQSDPRAGARTGGLLLLRGSSTCSAVCRCEHALPLQYPVVSSLCALHVDLRGTHWLVGRANSISHV